MTLHQHLCALTDKLDNCSNPASTTPKGKRLLCMLYDRIAWMLAPPSTAKEQRVSNIPRNEVKQRVIDNTPIIHILHLIGAPGIMKLRNPMAKCTLEQTPCASISESRRTTLQVYCLCPFSTALPGNPRELGCPKLIHHSHLELIGKESKGMQ